MNDGINWNLPVHVRVYLHGRCVSCNAINEMEIHDYGCLPYRELEQAMDKTNHPIKDLVCQQCGIKYSPEHVVYREAGSKSDIVRVGIMYGSVMSPEESAAVTEGHDRRFDIFKSQEKEFWSAYADFALEDWRASVNELLRAEIEEGYAALGMSHNFRTDQHARRDTLNRIQDRAAFWQAANRYFIYNELLDIGAIGWTPEVYTKRYGLRRSQFALLHFPVAEAHETLRIQAIGKLFRRDKGDNAFLLQHISKQSEQIELARKRIAEMYRTIEVHKAEIAEGQRKLANAYEKIRTLEDHRIESFRDPEDKQRLREQKTFIGELLTELRRLRALVPVEEVEVEESGDLEHVVPIQDTNPDLSQLSDITIAIIGDLQVPQKALEKYPCRILVNDGNKLDPDFYAVLASANVLVILTRKISHAAMWETKAHAIETGKPFLPSRMVNIMQILVHVFHLCKKNGMLQVIQSGEEATGWR
ncbi:DUF2325 domain-containing protein [Paenibacillus oralis]|uniref:DUF2325 domain-containing protein n=1 Tax=Paenibacillus oralis TaxID=2490856 RepID=A0A3P3TBM2_9BACL|nr:DUF2325 domain-containing protein [Paenibacillus oralis]RRJ54919.1 DUF2325 domain-containing protein [Paenibacillus oralis]